MAEFRKIVAIGVSVAALAVAGLAHAQAAQGSEGAEDTSGDIIVTANKREQSINDVGMTIQALSSDDLTERGVGSPADLGKLVPGFTYTQSTFVTPVFVLRGIGLYDAAFGSAPAVAVYTDQVPRNYPMMSDALDLDLERVEVLKGPQGTLFGQSATGGAINYITGKPTDRLAAGLDLSYERFGKVEVAGFVSGPLSDTLAARLAVKVVEGGAWQYSQSRPDDKNGATRKLMGRLSLDWKPTDKFRAQLSFTGARDHSDVQAPQYRGSFFNIYSTAGLAAANADPATRNPFGFANDALFAGITNPASPNYESTFLDRRAVLIGRLNGTNPALAAGARALLGTPNQTGNARAAEWTPNFLKESNNSYYQGTVRLDYELTDDITLTSITAYAKSKLDYHVDLDATIAESINVPVFGNIKAFNQEIRLSGKSDKLNWMIGGNYDNSSTQNDNFYILKDYTGNAPLGALGFANIDLTLNNFGSNLKTVAAFANGEYELTDDLTFSAGIRYTENKNKGTYCYNDPVEDTAQGTAPIFTTFSNLFTGRLDPATFTIFPGMTSISPILPGECFPLGDGLNGTTLFEPTRTPFVANLKQSNWSFRAGIDYKLPSGGLLYLTVSQGYKTGVFSNIGASSTQQYTPATQEKVVAYEAGFKLPLANNKVNVSGAVFYYNYSDKQIRTKISVAPWGLLEKLVNVPKSYIWGIEGELSARPIDGLTFSASGTYLKSKVNGSFTRTPDGTPVYNSQGYTADFNGSDLPYTPSFSGNADIQYEWPVGDSLQPFVGGTVVYQGRQNATFQNSVLKADLFDIPGYATVDLRAGIGDQDGKWKLTVFGRNVFDKYYTISPTYYHDAYFQMTGRPATYGVALKVRY